MTCVLTFYKGEIYSELVDIGRCTHSLPFLVSDPDIKIVVFGYKNLVVSHRYSVAERSSISRIIRLHPEAHGERIHARQTPDVHHVRDILLYEF